MHASQANHSIKALKAELVELGGSCDGCTEKAELLERLAAARARGASFKAPGPFAAPKSQPAPADNSPEAQEVRRVLETAPGAYYFILQINSDASDADLKKAYRKLALRLHPDKCHVAGADEAFKRVGAAFAVLSDSQKRSVHDLSGGDKANEARHARGESAHATPYRGAGKHAHGFRDTDAEELFRAFFGADAHSDGAGVATDDPTAIVQRAAGLVSRLAKTMYANPGTLIPALCALASVVSLLDTLSGLLGIYLLVAIPAAGLALRACPEEQRHHLAALALVIMCSGVLI